VGPGVAPTWTSAVYDSGRAARARPRAGAFNRDPVRCHQDSVDGGRHRVGLGCDPLPDHLPDHVPDQAGRNKELIVKRRVALIAIVAAIAAVVPSLAVAQKLVIV